MRAITPSPWGARDRTQGFPNATQAPYQLDIPSPLLVSWLKREMGRREPCLHLVHKGSSEMLYRSWWWEGMHSVTCWFLSSPQDNLTLDTSASLSSHGQLDTALPAAIMYDFPCMAIPHAWERVHAENTSLCRSLSNPREHRGSSPFH